MNSPPSSDVAGLAERAGAEHTSSIAGVQNKALILLSCVVGTSSLTFGLVGYCNELAHVVGRTNNSLLLFLGFLGVLTIWRKAWAPITAPLAAVTAGCFTATCTLNAWDCSSTWSFPLLSISFGPLLPTLAALRLKLVDRRDRAEVSLLAIIGGTFVSYVILLGLRSFGIPVRFGYPGPLLNILLLQIVPGTIVAHHVVSIKWEGAASATASRQWRKALWLILTPLCIYVGLVYWIKPCQIRSHRIVTFIDQETASPRLCRRALSLSHEKKQTRKDYSDDILPLDSRKRHGSDMG